MCRLLKVNHDHHHYHLHSTYDKIIIERIIQYINDRTECFDDYFPCRKKRERKILAFGSSLEKKAPIEA
jgi:hypothetical protein